MYHARLTAPRLQSTFAALLITASWTGFVAAQSAATSGDQWHAAGTASSASAQPAANSGTDPTWRLPNGQSNAGDAQLVDDPSNPLRQTRKQQPAKSAEPRAFQAPTNAAPMYSGSSAATSNKTYPTMQARANPMTVATRPGTVATQAYIAPRPLPNRAAANMQYPYAQPGNRPMPNNQSNANSNGGDLWQTINVAFNGPPEQATAPKPQKSQLKRSSENLPMPGSNDYELQEPVMRYPGGPGEFADHLGGPCYQPYCEQGNCCGGSCPTSCGGACCGDGVCEPGCDCPCGQPCGEPGCDCPSGNCKKDVFCIGPGDDESCHIVQVRWPKWQEVVVFGGVQGFKGPYDLARDSGNFGFNEGFNIGAKIPYAQLGYQFGYRGAQSQLNGDKNTGIDKSFNQSFVTAGLFHRQKEGVQFGVVWDALVDEREQTETFGQVRSEISCIGCGCHEFGLDATVGLNSNKVDDGTQTGTDATFQASDQYVLFYRLHGCSGGEGRFYAGVNNDADGIVGADTLIPIGGCFSFQSGFTYLIPHQKNGTEGAINESWNIGLGLVWHWDGQARKCYENCYRPLFNVADNGTLIVDHQGNDN